MAGVELRQLEYFVAVAEHLHFGRAAQALSIGQPAVSQQVARLERVLGVELLDRTPRSVRLTEAGARFLPQARAVLAAVDQARAAALDASADSAARLLRIGTSSGLGERLGRFLHALKAQVPAAEVELIGVPTRARLERVAAGQLDAAFVRGTAPVPGLQLIEVWTEPVALVLPADHELTMRSVVAIRDLADVPLRIVSRRLNPVLVDLVLTACADAGFVPVIADHPDSFEHLIAGIASGPPSWTVIYESHARMLAQSQVAFRPLEPALGVPTSLAVADDASSRAVGALLRACEAAAADSPS